MMAVSVASDLQQYFSRFRENIIGINHRISTPVHRSVRMLYADWTASGRCYWPIEEKLINDILPLIANTHTETSHAGAFISAAYREARTFIKAHVNAGADDILIAGGSGMTDVVNKLQRILGLRVPEQFRAVIHERCFGHQHQRPVVLVTHMEHHSNHTSWLETVADVVVVEPGADGRVSLANFEEAVAHYAARPLKIAAITSCSNVTGIMTPYHEIAAIMHRHGGYCFVDFATSAPYVAIDIHPADPLERLDAIYFSPHKFLGGPGSSGILVFNAGLYSNQVPDTSGGGTVDWTNPWGGRKYLDDVELREDGGTPAILQTIKAALAMKLKEEMDIEAMRQREEELLRLLWDGLKPVKGLRILAAEQAERLPVLSFCLEGMRHHEVVRQLNDRWGIQCRGGCSCAGTYGHYLLGIGKERSAEITDLIDKGDHSAKPGWVRISLHPTMTDEEVALIAEAVTAIAAVRRP